MMMDFGGCEVVLSRIKTNNMNHQSASQLTLSLDAVIGC